MSISPPVNPFEQAIADDIADREHTIVIRTQYGETVRECYCDHGAHHHENEYQWTGPNGEDWSK